MLENELSVKSKDEIIIVKSSSNFIFCKLVVETDISNCTKNIFSKCSSLKTAQYNTH